MRLDLEQWRELASPVYDVQPREPEAHAGVGIDVKTCEELLLTKLSAPAQMLVHEPANSTDTCHDYLLFERFHSGGGHGEAADVGFTIAQPNLHLIDMSQRYVTMQERGRSQGVCIPHGALGYGRGEEPVFSSLEIDSPKGRLLAAAHTELVSAQSHGATKDAALIAQIFVDLVRRLMLGPERQGTAAQDEDLPVALLLRDYILTNLHRADLDADTLASAFGISRATLYRHFESEGGVNRCIRDRRLDRCFFELAGAKAERGKVAAVARRWHFTDATHFNRLFRQRFSLSPSQCLSRGMHPGSRAPSEQLRIAQEWLEQFRQV